MKLIEEKIRRAVNINSLSTEILGERNWYNYFIRVTPLSWAINLRDGYKIEVYEIKYGKHLSTLII